MNIKIELNPISTPPDLKGRHSVLVVAIVEDHLRELLYFDNDTWTLSGASDVSVPIKWIKGWAYGYNFTAL